MKNSLLLLVSKIILEEMMQLKKFTLIELLVVVAIIGILASLLLPVLGKAREKAKIAVCKSNQKQISIALTMFLDDNDDYYPVNQKDWKWSWDDQLSSYDGRNLSDDDKDLDGFTEGQAVLYHCPSDDVTRTNNKLPLSYGLSLGRGGPGSWLYNYPGITAWPGEIPPKNSSRITDTIDPSEVIVMAERPSANNYVGTLSIHENLTAQHVQSTIDQHHKGLRGTNYQLMDGSVHFLTYYTTAASSNGGFQPPNSMWDAHKGE